MNKFLDITDAIWDYYVMCVAMVVSVIAIIIVYILTLFSPATTFLFKFLIGGRHD